MCWKSFSVFIIVFINLLLPRTLFCKTVSTSSISRNTWLNKSKHTLLQWPTNDCLHNGNSYRSPLVFASNRLYSHVVLFLLYVIATVHSCPWEQTSCLWCGDLCRQYWAWVIRKPTHKYFFSSSLSMLRNYSVVMKTLAAAVFFNHSKKKSCIWRKTLFWKGIFSRRIKPKHHFTGSVLFVASL